MDPGERSSGLPNRVDLDDVAAVADCLGQLETVGTGDPGQRPNAGLGEMRKEDCVTGLKAIGLCGEEPPIPPDGSKLVVEDLTIITTASKLSEVMLGPIAPSLAEAPSLQLWSQERGAVPVGPDGEVASHGWDLLLRNAQSIAT